MMRSEMLHIDGHPFHMLVDGPKGAPLLLFLHGFPEYSGAFEEVLPLLAADYLCVAPDQRGFGASWRPAEVSAYAMPALMGDMVAVINHFGGSAAAVIGHDWGAAVAYALAFRRPDLMDKLIVINGVHPAPFQKAMAAGGAQTEASQYISWLRSEGSEQALAANEHEKMFSIFSKHMDMSWMTPQRRAAYRAAWGDANQVRGMVNWYRASRLKLAKPGQPIPESELPEFPTDALRVSMPHLLIWGLQDRALLPESRAGLEQYCDDLTIKEIATADHWICHQYPEEVAHYIRQFAPPP